MSAHLGLAKAQHKVQSLGVVRYRAECTSHKGTCVNLSRPSRSANATF